MNLTSRYSPCVGLLNPGVRCLRNTPAGTQGGRAREGLKEWHGAGCALTGCGHVRILCFLRFPGAGRRCGCAQGPRVGPGGIGQYIPKLGCSKTQSKVFLKHLTKQNTFLARLLAQAPRLWLWVGGAVNGQHRWREELSGSRWRELGWTHRLSSCCRLGLASHLWPLRLLCV